MEYSEPLNLSIKKKPIAVVPPSSSSQQKISQQQDDLHQTQLMLHHQQQQVQQQSTNATTTNQQFYNKLTSPIIQRSYTPLETIAIDAQHNNASTQQQSPAAPTIITSAVAAEHSNNNTHRPLDALNLFATTDANSAALMHATTLSTYLNQQQSLDIAKLHLERYLKLTDQYLQTTTDIRMTTNETINHLIRTNILTNKIAANNLISIINKLLEQNIMSEYYFKHVTSGMHQQQQLCGTADGRLSPEKSATATTSIAAAVTALVATPPASTAMINVTATTAATTTVTSSTKSAAAAALHFATAAPQLSSGGTIIDSKQMMEQVAAAAAAGGGSGTAVDQPLSPSSFRSAYTEYLLSNSGSAAAVAAVAAAAAAAAAAPSSSSSSANTDTMTTLSTIISGSKSSGYGQRFIINVF